MPKTIRKQLLDYSTSSLAALRRLDTNLYNMDMLARGRQPAIEDLKAILIEGHEQLRVLWQALHDAL